jgi:hypothetical protein
MYDAFEAGMDLQTTKTGFYLYNAALGIALHCEYASAERPARLAQILMSPDSALPWVGGGTPEPSGGTRASPVAARPDRTALSLIGIQLPDGAQAATEVSGTVLATTWTPIGGSKPVLYVFEAAAGQGGIGQPPGGGGSGAGGSDFAEREYYLEFGLDEIAPAA